MKRLIVPIVGMLASQIALGATSDPLEKLQWGLHNDGTPISEVITDFKSRVVKSVPGIDIGAAKARASFAQLQKKTVVVAVIDSGVDIEHPELAGKIFTNSADCDSDDKVPFKPDVDKDGNGYKGDCKGWNVSGSGDSNRVLDDTGHGTHVAGLIAALSSNGVGIAGVVPDVKILPIKITFATDSGNKLADRVEAALKYAMAMKADVINMSMGWPSSSDAPNVRAAFKEAAARNIPIVVAAGNNTTNKPFFPCAYEQVICVGAITSDGTASPFSNFGAHIDLVAPGSKILSTIPTARTPTGGITLKGYDYKSGTSQAAPFVTSAVAILKSINPSLTIPEIRARLAVGTRKVPAQISLDGLVQVDAALAAQPQVVLRPLIKDARLSKVDSSNHFTMQVGVSNLWLPAHAVALRVTAPAGVTLSNGDVAIGDMAAGTSQTFAIEGRVDDVSRAQELDFKVEIATQGQSVFQATFTQTLILDSGATSTETTVPFANANPMPANLSTVNAVGHPTATPEFFDQINKDGQTTLRLFRQINGSYQPTSIQLPAVDTIFQFSKLDLDQDGKDDYFLLTLEGQGQQKDFRIRYLNQDLKPLYDFTSASYEAPVAVLNFTQMIWISTTYNGRAMKVPVYLESGVVAPADAVKDPFETQDDNVQKQRVYFLQPTKTDAKGLLAFKVRELDHHYAIEAVRKTIGAADRDSLRFVMTTSPTRLLLGRQGDATDYYQVEITKGPAIGAITHVNGSFDLSGYQPVQKPTTQQNSGVQFLQRQQNTQIVEFAVLNGAQKPLFLTYTHDMLGDSILGVDAAMEDQTGYTFVIETKIRLVAAHFDRSGQGQFFETPIHRTSLLASRIFSELFEPMLIGGKPAVYVDASQIFAGQIHAVELSNNSFSPSIENSRIVDANCDAMNPFVGAQASSFVLFCRNSSSASLKFIEMK